MNSSQNWLFETYNGTGPALPLIAAAVSMNAVGMPGIIMNLFLCYATIRTKSLRSNTNYLLFLTALCECMHESGHMIYLAVAVSGTNFIPYPQSIAFQYQACFGVAASQAAMSATAIDRALAVTSPIFYNSFLEHYRFLYLGFWTAACSACGVYMVALGYFFAQANSTIYVTGYISDLFIGDMTIIFEFVMVSCVLNIVCYGAVGAYLLWRFKIKRKSTDDRQSRIILSLVVILCVVTGGYLFNDIVKMVVNVYITLSPQMFYFLQVIGGILLNIGAASSTPILYAFSSDYRKIFEKQFAAICPCCQRAAKSNRIQTQGLGISAIRPSFGTRNNVRNGLQRNIATAVENEMSRALFVSDRAQSQLILTRHN